MPTVATATIHTDQFVNGDTRMHVQCHVGDEEAIAFPTVPGVSLFNVLLHFLTVRPLGENRLRVRPRAGYLQRWNALVRREGRP